MEKQFKIGQKVKFAFSTSRGSVSRGKGVITKLVPKTAVRGAMRLTVKTDDGRVLRPYPSQCTVA